MRGEVNGFTLQLLHHMSVSKKDSSNGNVRLEVNGQKIYELCLLYVVHVLLIIT